MTTMMTMPVPVGLDGAESMLCDLSGRALTTSQVERTLRIFETAVAVDLSNNELEMMPKAIPNSVVNLDVSFNLLCNVCSLDRLQHLQDLNLSYNRLQDVSLLESCPLLLRINLRGNRLVNTRGLEMLLLLENLDLSENLIEHSEAVRPLSLNQSLTHLSVQGNPLCSRTDYRVILLDMIPSVLMLDGKKVRNSVKYRTHEGTTCKTLSYSRLYDDKKQFQLHHRHRLGRRRTADKLDSRDAVTQERIQALQLHLRTNARAKGDQTTALSRNIRCASSDSNMAANGSVYMSMYDRIALANGNSRHAKVAESSVSEASESSHTAVNGSSTSRPTISPPNSKMKQARSIFAGGSHQRRPSEPASAPPSRNNSFAKYASPPQLPNRSASLARMSTARSSISLTPETTIALSNPLPLPAAASSSHLVISSLDGAYGRGSSIHSASRGRAMALSSSVQPPQSTPATSSSLEDRQQSVLNVIQSLIQHKKQTLAALAQASSA